MRSGTAHVGFSFLGVGYGSALVPVGHVAPSAQANRVLYRRAGLSEWYVNGPLGLEQGFTVLRAPAGRPAGPLTLSMALSGKVRASLAPGGQSLTLSGAGKPVLRYTGLTATDARGRLLRSWLQLDGGRLLLRIDSTSARYPLRIDPFIQQGEKLTGSGEIESGAFGQGIALSADGNTALISAPTSNGGEGSAWIFTRSGSTWTQQSPKLTGSDEIGYGHFGQSVALSSDGNTALIGGYYDNSNVGAAWVFTRSGSTWTQQGAKLTGSEEIGGFFGESVALSSDGNTALIGGYFDNSRVGAAWVFTRSGSTWTQQGEKLTGGGEVGEGYFGWGVALSGDGNTVLVGGRDNGSIGAAWVFTNPEAATVEGGPEGAGGSLPSNSAPPTIGGDALAGQILTDIQGTWSGSPTVFGYQWEDCDASGSSCNPIAGAVEQHYVLQMSDVGSRVRVREAATNSNGTGSSAWSAPTAVVVLPPKPPLPRYVAPTDSIGQLSLGGGGCTGTVIRGALNRSVVLTAAHCVLHNGSPVNSVVFAPGHYGSITDLNGCPVNGECAPCSTQSPCPGTSPYGIWRIPTGAAADIFPNFSFTLTGSPAYDYAFITFPAGPLGFLEDMVGGLPLVITNHRGQEWLVFGYGAATTVGLESCGPSAAHDTFTAPGPPRLQFGCNAIQGGWSGGPWLNDANGVKDGVGAVTNQGETSGILKLGQDVDGTYLTAETGADFLAAAGACQPGEPCGSSGLGSVPSYPVVAGRVRVAQAADPPTASVTATAFARGGFAAMASKHHRRPARIDIGFVRVRIPRHHMVQIKIRLTRHGLKLIKQRHHMLVEVVIHAIRTAGGSVVLRHGVVITG